MAITPSGIRIWPTERPFGLFHIVVGILKEGKDNVFDIFSHIAGFGQVGRIGNGERYVENPRQRLGHQGLAAPGGSQPDHVAMLGHVVEAVVVRHDLLAVELRLFGEREGLDLQQLGDVRPLTPQEAGVFTLGAAFFLQDVLQQPLRRAQLLDQQLQHAGAARRTGVLATGQRTRRKTVAQFARGAR